ncbi:1b31888d-3e57-4839-9a02-f3d290c4474a [Sclerotinia trifoliorum]|uniref:1b31888d-3e57-4839-9a02-f3d290c4474a n=1 Tax=Sclerotinia trifoliorum TaxID=28548 RepID=A0A8H2W757_9HELO|nr:1b31888d-3e57-4839-9a02-f3d290c4474a [Sclerotinia trifoliorum]
MSGALVRAGARNGEITGQTSALAPHTSKLILSNPVPCPLIAKSASIGSYNTLDSWIEGVAGEDLAADVDIRIDIPKYMVYENGELLHDHVDDIKAHWTEDHVAFLIGCSYSFEGALIDGGLMPQHIRQRRNVPMYKTNIMLCPAGVFDQGTYVVSMRPYKKDDIEKVRNITRPYLATHGEPIAWGWDAVEKLGIQDIAKPDWGDISMDDDGYPLVLVGGREDEIVPVFWGCGVTPQHAVVSAGLEGIVMGHAPGHMLVLDCRDGDLVKK